MWIGLVSGFLSGPVLNSQIGYTVAALSALYGVEYVADLPLLSLILPKVRELFDFRAVFQTLALILELVYLNVSSQDHCCFI